MKFTPRRIREEVNVSREHPLREFLHLAGGILGAFLVIYVVLGLAVELIVPHIGRDLEDHLGRLMQPAQAEGESPPPAQERLQKLLDRLVSNTEDPQRQYRIHLLPSQKINAGALPGGHIVVLSGLIREAKSENELAMVLAHELGHFRGRDHLRGLGRGLVLVFLSSLLFGTDSALSRLTTSLLVGAEMKFSQRQEVQADAWGLNVLVKTYGHAGGAVDFFQRMAVKEEGKELAYFLASHPYPRERIEALEKTIREEGYSLRATVPLDDSILDNKGTLPETGPLRVPPRDGSGGDGPDPGS